ncbi:conserved Plasmodium protein, unknown function [Plasmodium berghei]|uniref:Uncharacterized protein n=2 Tax=Plasmodium berghei TaxID=5821 RepID=A0A509AGH9_PLABA|nr:conserved protein, unknown function [Plasmodium berghei ANKA]CXI09341.1 conserved Plasmodium protein, unknown function [Plasmodium berghei]SCL92848.1 conserved Plasmodium protein, unknown function [Plasmodium berghei]SCM15734.1 conserved Plasmodium protein, unknown function [Plasmodium berghei]SCM17529.1 conserved Plasmodium protein, unknown function [Plasmodium berghei]SCN22943.1 conserved Plasmodium protein, unknown function [Plasmodium berghei]|eukprot:XP_034420340.1 conserved protein, unknown function [Plasmodium berghei ANKA]
MEWLGSKIIKGLNAKSVLTNYYKIYRQYYSEHSGINKIAIMNSFRNSQTQCNKSIMLQNIINKVPSIQYNINHINKRFYNPRENINWILIRFRHRVSQLRKKKLKYKNHSKVALRFRLTKFGWERLQSGRNASKRNLSVKKYNEKMKIKYVSRDDIKKFKFQMPSYVLRIRDSPVNYNPNIMRSRKFLPSHFG